MKHRGDRGREDYMGGGGGREKGGLREEEQGMRGGLGDEERVEGGLRTLFGEE